jgi:5-hydroxyisourate hydrolase-like protein (transthyretin family)
MHLSCRKHFLPAFFCLAFFCFLAFAQTSGDSSAKTGTISGRVMIDDKPAVGVIVTLARENFNRNDPQPKATTNDDGHYTLNNVPAGSWRIQPAIAAYTMVEQERNSNGRLISISEGETLTSVDLKLIPGGVITGKVMTADGRPIIGQRVLLTMVLSAGQKRPWYSQNAEMFRTDDRGIYRIYGLPEADYLVSFDGNNSGFAAVSGMLFKKTWHPAALSEEQAKKLHVSPGGEITEANIILNSTEQGYTISGRVVDDATSQPVTGLRVTAFTEAKNGQREASMSSAVAVNGTFRIDGVPTGARLLVTSARDTDPEKVNPYYSDPVACEVTNADVSGIEIRMHRAGTVSGIIVPEPGSSPEIVSRLRRLTLNASTQARTPGYVRWSNARQAPDGAFRLEGLAPGRLLTAFSNTPDARHFVVLRMERDGVHQRDGLEVGPGEQITGVRITVGYAGSRIAGQVVVEGGELPAGATLQVLCVQPATRFGRGSEASSDRRFVIENLPAGNYELRVSLIFRMPDGNVSGRGPLMLAPNRLPVTIGSNERQNITLNVRLEEAPRSKGVPQ